jgi:hypothetical protein
MSTAEEIANLYGVTGCLDVHINNVNGYSGKPLELCIDELGRERLPAIYFGNKLNVMRYILHQRYGLWRSRGVITHVTSNFTPNDVNRTIRRFYSRSLSANVQHGYCQRLH